MNLRYWTKRLSSPYTPENPYLLKTGGLLLVGVIAGLLQLHLRYPLNIPGHHGLEWMALLLMGRFCSKDLKAATLVASAAAITYIIQLPLLTSSHSLKPAAVFVLTGLCSDYLFSLTRERLHLITNGAIIGGLAFVTKPIVFYGIYLLGGVKLGMFSKHPDYLPFITHLIFGAVGGVGGAILAGFVRSKRSTERHRS